MAAGGKKTAHPRLHLERHFSGGVLMRDIVIGMSDGLTVPFALAAGIATAAAQNRLVVTAGLAEIAAGAISMGLGGYLAGRSEVEHYARERSREEREIVEIPEEEEQEIVDIFEKYGMAPEETEVLVRALKRRPAMWRDFMMKFELGLEEPDPRQALLSALTIGGAYVVGGLVPLSPYMLLPSASGALTWSVAITLAALFVFGFVKGRYSGNSGIGGAVRTMVIGGLAAAVAFLIARLIA